MTRIGIDLIYETANVAPRVRKADLVERIAGAVGVPSELFESLEKANHDVLEQIAAKFNV